MIIIRHLKNLCLSFSIRDIRLLWNLEILRCHLASITSKYILKVWLQCCKGMKAVMDHLTFVFMPKKVIFSYYYNYKMVEKSIGLRTVDGFFANVLSGHELFVFEYSSDPHTIFQRDSLTPKSRNPTGSLKDLKFPLLFPSAFMLLSLKHRPSFPP